MLLDIGYNMQDESARLLAFGKAYVANHELDLLSIAIMFCRFNSVAYIYRLVGMDMLKIWSHVEGNCIQHAGCRIILKFEFDVLKILAYEFRRAEIEYVAGTEHWFLISRSVGIQFSEGSYEFGSQVGKLDSGINIELRRELVGLNMFGHKLLKAASEFGDVFFL